MSVKSNYLIVCFTVLMCLFNTPPASARHLPTQLTDDATSYAKDFRHVFSAPARFTSTQWLVTGTVLATTASLFVVDEEVRDFAQASKGPFLDRLMPVGDLYGRMLTTGGTSLLVYLSGIVFDDPETRLTGRAMFEAVSFSLAITGTAKVVFGRSRPYTNRGAMDFRWFELSHDNRSLPSGHATASFALSGVLSKRFSNPWATAGLYSLASLTLINRLYDDMHWLSDTFLGAAIGTTIGLAVGERLNKQEAGRASGKNPEIAAPLEYWSIKIAF